MPPRPLTDLEFMLLLATLRAGDEAYGVEIARELEKTGGRTVLLGSIYATLDRLERAGVVRSSFGEPTPERGGRAKRYFRVTPAGVRALKATQKAFVSLWHGIPELKGESS
jgi:PadR family transcriptional regulator PadR